MKFILIFLFLIVSANLAFACDTDIKIKQIHGLEHPNKDVRADITNFLETKGHQIVLTNSTYTAKVVLSKGLDYQSPDKLFAKASLSLYKGTKLVNYVFGMGKIYKTDQLAYTYQMFRIAIESAIAHLPKCSNL